MSASERERVEVWRDSDRAWRWRYVGAGNDEERVELPSNEKESSCDEAVAAAQVAYPELTVYVLEDGEGDEHRSKRREALAALAAVTVGVRFRPRWTAVLAVIATGTLVYRIRARRSS